MVFVVSFFFGCYNNRSDESVEKVKIKLLWLWLLNVHSTMGIFLESMKKKEANGRF